jgi:protein-S-isoprenylcysteine O-methyltransferase Ste14
VFAAFFVLYVYCSFVLTSRGRGAYVEFDPPQEFVASGPYRWVRNPVAACLVGMLLGEAVALSSTGVFLLFLGSLLPAHLQVVLMEEPLLRKRFGQAYADYLRRVPRWIPRLPDKEAP